MDLTHLIAQGVEDGGADERATKTLLVVRVLVFSTSQAYAPEA